MHRKLYPSKFIPYHYFQHYFLKIIVPSLGKLAIRISDLLSFFLVISNYNYIFTTEAAVKCFINQTMGLSVLRGDLTCGNGISERRNRHTQNVPLTKTGQSKSFFLSELFLNYILMQTIFWLENLKRTDHSQEPGVDGKIILKWILGEKDGTECIWLRKGPLAGGCEHGNETSDYIK
jgi:hypothetical protein